MKKSVSDFSHLSKKQYHILRKKGTEPPFTGKLLHNKVSGTYSCVACGSPLFSSKTKFDSGSGWPSFFEANKNVEIKKDSSVPIPRTEVLCKNCGSHLGHLFYDAPQTPTGKRFCINSTALNFKTNKSNKKK